MVIRFRDYGKRLADFEQEILVRCPQCDAYGGLRLRIAKVLTVNSEQSSLSSIKRITCQHCSYTKQQSKDGNRKAVLLLWQNNYSDKRNSSYGILDHFFGLYHFFVRLRQIFFLPLCPLRLCGSFLI